MRIGYCSPFNPMKSGISDFSEELIFALKDHMEIVIFSPVPVANKRVVDEFAIYTLGDLHQDSLRKTLDLIVYHIGNHFGYHEDILKFYYQYPGILELHDVGLHHMVAEGFDKSGDWNGYVELARYCHGKRGERIAQDFVAGITKAPWDIHSSDMPMSRRVIEAATGVIVHSDYAKQMVLGCCPDVPITNIMHHSANIENPAAWKAACRKSLKLTSTKLVMGSFGLASTAKRILPILDSLRRFKENESIDFLYYIVGDSESGMNLPEQVKARGLEDNVRITGFTSLEEFKTYMGACDFCLALRYPTQGESSGSLHRMLGMGKPVIVTDIGTFGDYPDEIVVKVRYDEREVDDIYDAIRALASSEKELKRRSLAALEFARKKCDINTNALHYKTFFEQILNHTWQPDYEDDLIGKLCELGLRDDDYIEHIWKLTGLFMRNEMP